MKKLQELIVRALLVFITLATLIFKVEAQVGAGSTVKVTVSVMPPYSTNAKDYIQQGNNVMITITNLTSIPQQVIVIPSLVGNNGVKVALRSNYQPPAGLLLGPAQVRTITLNQLKATNSTVTANDIIVENFSKENYINNIPIPEGLYTVCATVKSFSPSVNFTEQGCATFMINSYDPPIILNPVNNAFVKPLNPQFISFGWTPSGIAGKTKYTFKLVDLTTNPINNPNDAFENNNILPFFQQTNIITNNLVLDNSKPKLKEGNRYALQVVAYDPQSKMLYKNKGRSQVIVFTYKQDLLLVATPVDPPNAQNPNDPPVGPCVAGTKWNGQLKQSNKNGIPNGTPIMVGHFVMKNTQFTQSNGSYSGTGEILVNFVHSKVKVEFSGINIGDDNRMYAGKITGKVTSASVINDAMAKDKTGTIESVPNMDQLMNYLENAQRNIKNLNPASLTDLPVHIDKSAFNIGIVGMIFEPTEAYVNTVLNTPLPQAIGNSYLLLSAKGIAVHPNGFGVGDVKVSLAKDVSVSLSDKLSLTFTGGANKTFATFNCDGFKSLTLNGAVALERNIALPLDNNLDVIADNNLKVKAPFELKNITSVNEFILDISNFSHKFAIPDANDFAIECKNLTIDLSTTANGTAFNAAYPAKAQKKDWIGVYVKSITMSLPEGFRKKGGGRMTISAENAFVDKMGFTGTLVASGSMFAEGTVAGWGIELNKIDMKIDKSKLAGGGFGGILSLPLGDKTDLGFFASVSKGNANGANVQLKVETKDVIDANLFLAKIKLYEGSSVEIGRENGKYYAQATLNGEIGINITPNNNNTNVSRFDLPDIKFQELTIDGKDQPGYVPNFDLKFASLQSQKGIQAKVGGFELNLNDLQFKKSGDKKSAGLSINLGLSLFGGGNDGSNGAGATTAFTIWAKHDGSRFKYDKASLDAISIDVDMGVAKLKGSINIYDEDPTYGNGFRGQVAASLAGLGVGIDVTLQFGKTLQDKGNFKYWYFDAMVDFGKLGLNIPGTAASIYGFGGGAWCNMKRSGGSDVIKPGGFKPAAKGGGAPTSSGVTMVPEKNKAGFKAAVLFGITGSREAFNGDLTFTMELNSQSLAVNHVMLEGNAYLMQNPENASRRDPSKAFLYCNAKIEYDAPTRVLSGNFGAHVNILTIIEGGGDISFKFDMPDRDKNGNVKPNQNLKWYIKVGQWTPNKDPFEDDARLHAEIGFDAKVLKVEIELQGYFMVGNDLPSGLPPLPDAIYAMTKNMGAPVKKDLPASVSNTQSLAFAFGAGIKLTAGFDIKIVSAHVEAAAGFDVLISDLNATCNGKDMGFNGWYAQGQAYAYIKGNIKLVKATVATVEAGAVFQVKLPNPTWVKGDVYFHLNILHIIEGSFWRTIEKGKMCNDMETDVNPFETVKLIKNVTPSDKTKDINPLNVEMRVDFTYASGGGAPIKIYNTFTESYDYYYSSTTVKFMDKNKKEISDVKIKGIGNYPHKSFTLQSETTLQPNTDYYVYAKASVTGEKTEELYTKFTTGNRPAKFGMKDLYESYPLPNQRYFMKQEPNGKPTKGFLGLKQDLAYLFNDGGEVYVMFLDKSGHVVGYDKAVGYTSEQFGKASSKVVFDIPAELKNSTIYELKLLTNDKNGGALGEVLFEGFYFKTSKYNNFPEKLNSFNIVKTGYIRHTLNLNYNNGAMTNENAFYVPVLMMQGGEGLDGYEMHGYYTKVGDDLESGDKLIFAHNNESYLGDMGRKYKSYLQYNGHRIPELNESEASFMAGLTNKISKWTSRPAGFPFDGIEMAEMFSGSYPGEMFWMKNVKTYEPILKQRGDLKSSERIVGAEPPLSADEINGGGKGPGFANQQLGKQGPGDTKTEYYALMDYTPFIAVWDQLQLSKKLLNKAKEQSAQDLNKTWNLLKKMGLPKMPAGPVEVTLTTRNMGQKMIRKLNYNYAPPK